MKCTSRITEVATTGRGLYDVTSALLTFVRGTEVVNGLATVYVRHTSASLVIQENADPAVLRDLQRWMDRIAPEDSGAYEHDDEGPDDMPGHLRAAVTRSSESIPVSEGELLLGQWQAVYLWEHRAHPHRRQVVFTVMGE